MNTPADRHLIVGGGLAGAKAAQGLRRLSHQGPITLVGAEAEVPYNRPPLSKEYLGATVGRSALQVLPGRWYTDRGVDLKLGTRATAVDPQQHLLTLSTGEQLGYDKLLLATGSRVVRLALPGADLDGVLYLRTADDSDRIRDALSTASRIVVVGAGWVGLEVAAAARARGVAVTLLEAARLPLLGVLGPEVAPHFAALHLRHGVDLRCGVQPEAITGRGGRVTGVDLAGGGHVEADAVMVGVGVSPRTELAQRAGLAVDDGILVDAGLRTSEVDVYAAGDVANAWHPLLHRRVRVEHWSNAAWQARVAAEAMLGGEVSYDRLPYFFSDQYDVAMEYTGGVGEDGYDQVVFRGDPTTQSYIAFWLRRRRLLAGMSVNTPGVIRDITTLVRSQAPLDLDALAEPTRPLATLLHT